MTPQACQFVLSAACLSPNASWRAQHRDVLHHGSTRGLEAQMNICAARVGTATDHRQWNHVEAQC